MGELKFAKGVYVKNIDAWRSGLTLFATAVAIVLIAQAGGAAVKTRIDFDKEFDFTKVR